VNSLERKKCFAGLQACGYRIIWLVSLLALGTTLDCKQTHEGGDTQTNWLKSCSDDADCGKLSCSCGHCVQPCSSAADCSEAPGPASCQSSAGSAVQTLCGGPSSSAGQPSSAGQASSPAEPGASGICLTTCTDQNPCPATQRCVAGACLPASASSPDGPDGAAPPLVSSDFCPRLYEALCNHVERCGCDATSCRTFAAQTCTDPGDVWAA
jgi:hypothetical protein